MPNLERLHKRLFSITAKVPARDLPVPLNADFLEGIPRPPSFLLEPWARSRSLTLLSAEPFVGKSALLTAIACSVAYGHPFLGYAPRRARVLYFALDSPAWDTRGLILKIKAGLGIPAIEPDPNLMPERNLCIMTARNMDLLMGDIYASIAAVSDFTPVQVSEDGDEDHVADTPSLILVDTLRSIHHGEENDAREMSLVMEHLRFLSEAGYAVVLAHHTAKSAMLTGGYAARGSTVIPADADIHVRLQKRRDTITATWVKGRGGDCPERLTYSMSWDAERLTFSTTTLSPRGQIDAGASYTWNDLTKRLRLGGQELHLEILRLGLVKGTDKRYRLPILVEPPVTGGV